MNCAFLERIGVFLERIGVFLERIGVFFPVGSIGPENGDTGLKNAGGASQEKMNKIDDGDLLKSGVFLRLLGKNHPKLSEACSS